MGALYKTASPETVDFMYKLPQEQLIAAMKVNEQNIDTQYQQFAVLNDQLLKLKSLAADQPEVKKYLDEMEEKVTSLTKTLQNDPMAWKKQMPLVRDLGQQIHKDFTRGKAAHWQSQYDAFQAADTKEKARIGLPIDKGGITPEQYELWKNATLGGFKGSKFDDAAGTGKSIGIENVYGNQNIPEKIQKFMKDQIANSDSHFNVHTGQWVYTDKTTHESMTQEEVIRNATNLAMADPDIMGYARQMQSWNPNFGYSEKDASGQEQFIAPYTVDDKGRMSVNNKSFMAPALRGLAGVYGFDKITKDVTVPKENQFYLNDQTAAQAKDLEVFKKKLTEPEVIPPILTTRNQKLFSEGELSVKNLDGIIAAYNSLPPEQRTADAEAKYLSAIENKAAIEKGARNILLGPGKMTEATFQSIFPYLGALTKGGIAKPEPILSVTNKIDPKKLPSYDERLWTPEMKYYGNGMYRVEFQPTAENKKVTSTWSKYKDKTEEVTKVMEQNQYVKTQVIPVDPNTSFGKVQVSIGNTLAAGTTDYNILDQDGNPIELKLDTNIGWGFGEKSINTINDLLPYLKQKSTKQGGSTYTVEYEIDPTKLPDGALQYKGTNKNYSGPIMVQYDNNTASEAENSVLSKLGKNSPDVQAYQMTSNDPVMRKLNTKFTESFNVDKQGNLNPNNPIPSHVSLAEFIPGARMDIVRVGGEDAYTDVVFYFPGEDPLSQHLSAGTDVNGNGIPFTKSMLLSGTTDIVKQKSSEYWLKKKKEDDATNSRK